MFIFEKYSRLYDKYEDVIEYRGQDFENRLSWVHVKSAYASAVWESFLSAKVYFEREWIRNLQNSDDDPKGFGIHGHMAGVEITIFMDVPPIKRMDYMFSLFDNRFKIVDGPLLVLPQKIDAFHIDDRIYFFTKKGRSIFQMAEEIDAQCEDAIKKIMDVGVIAPNSGFLEYARKGHNPRRLMAFSETECCNKLQLLADQKRGKRIRKAFGIELSENKISPQSLEETDKIIKMITNRGMIEPFSEDAMEVSGAIPWRKV